MTAPLQTSFHCVSFKLKKLISLRINFKLVLLLRKITFWCATPRRFCAVWYSFLVWNWCTDYWIAVRSIQSQVILLLLYCFVLLLLYCFVLLLLYCFVGLPNTIWLVSVMRIRYTTCFFSFTPAAWWKVFLATNCTCSKLVCSDSQTIPQMQWYSVYFLVVLLLHHIYVMEAFAKYNGIKHTIHTCVCNAISDTKSLMLYLNRWICAIKPWCYWGVMVCNWLLFDLCTVHVHCWRQITTNWTCTCFCECLSSEYS